jgi:nicotinamidase-related amidase
MTERSFLEGARPFLDDLEGWMEALPGASLGVLTDSPHKVAVISVDMIEGFCSIGPLSSPRVAGITQPIVRLFERAWEAEVRHFLLTQDTHEPDAVEFGQFPPHCVRGTPEAETVAAFKTLPFFEHFVVLEKNSISSGLDTGLNSWIAGHPEVDTFLVVGDCTDLCTYQLAMHLRLDANARQLARRVIVPADCVQTYDRPLEAAKIQGGFAHPGDLLHAIFLYHMALNGIEVVASLQ